VREIIVDNFAGGGGEYGYQAGDRPLCGYAINHASLGYVTLFRTSINQKHNFNSSYPRAEILYGEG